MIENTSKPCFQSERTTTTHINITKYEITLIIQL